VPVSLTLKTRADLFAQLGAMERAGLPASQAMGLTNLPANAQSRLAEARKCIDSGVDIASAGLASGLFTKFEASLLHVACSAGSPARTYCRLAELYARRVTRMSAMKSRMMLPIAMIVIASFVRPLPKAFSGVLSPGQYLMTSLMPLMALAVAVYLFIELPRRLSEDSWLMRNLRVENMYRWVPWFGSMDSRRNARDFLESLALLVEAGMPILQALPIAENTIQNLNVRRGFAKVKSRIEAGASFAEALGELSFAGRSQAYALIKAGEVSGALPGILFRYTGFETTAIDQFDDQWTEWIPRIVYTGVAMWLGYGIIHSYAFMP